jgi:hypothetical protein
MNPIPKVALAIWLGSCAVARADLYVCVEGGQKVFRSTPCADASQQNVYRVPLVRAIRPAELYAPSDQYSEPSVQLPSRRGSRPSDAGYQASLRECTDAKIKVDQLASQSPANRAGVVVSMAKLMERACTPGEGMTLDANQRRSYCEIVTGYVSNLSEQSPNNRSLITGAYSGVLMQHARNEP